MGILAGIDYLSINYILGKVFIPIAYIMGVPSEETTIVAELIGVKTVINEFAAFAMLGDITDISERSRTIATYALCGFANPASMGKIRKLTKRNQVQFLLYPNHWLVFRRSRAAPYIGDDFCYRAQKFSGHLSEIISLRNI